MPYNPKGTWQNPGNPTVTGFRVRWKKNGSPIGQADYVRDGVHDGSGYVAFYSEATGGATPLPGDVVSATVASLAGTVEAVTPLTSSPVSLTIPNDPPPNPTIFTLSLT